MRELLFVSLLVLSMVWIWPSKAESGSDSPEGFDCSGLTSYVFEKSGRKILRHSRSQAISGVKVALEDAQRGDLIFFKGTDAESNRIGHSGIIVGGVSQEVEGINACNRGEEGENI